MKIRNNNFIIYINIIKMYLIDVKYINITNKIKNDKNIENNKRIIKSFF